MTSPEIGVKRAATPKSRYSNPTLPQGHLTQYLYGFRTPRDTPTNETHHHDDPGQPMGHGLQERASLRRAPSGSSTDSAAQRTRRTPDRFPTSHYSAATQRPAHKPYSNPRRHTRTPPAGPYAPNRTTPRSGALPVCAELKSLSTRRVPGQPGLARPPAPQDHNPEDDSPRPRAPTPKSA